MSPLLPLLALYLGAMVALGVRARRRSTTPDGFFVAGRSLGPFLSTCALSGTVVSGRAFLRDGGYNDEVYEKRGPGEWLVRSSVHVSAAAR